MHAERFCLRSAHEGEWSIAAVGVAGRRGPTNDQSHSVLDLERLLGNGYPWLRYRPPISACH